MTGAHLCRSCRGAGFVRELHVPGCRGWQSVPCSAPGCIGGVVTPAALGARLVVGWDGGAAVCRVVEVGLC